MLGSPRGVTSSSVMASSVAYIPFRDVTLKVEYIARLEVDYLYKYVYVCF